MVQLLIKAIVPENHTAFLHENFYVFNQLIIINMQKIFVNAADHSLILPWIVVLVVVFVHRLCSVAIPHTASIGTCSIDVNEVTGAALITDVDSDVSRKADDISRRNIRISIVPADRGTPGVGAGLKSDTITILLFQSRMKYKLQSKLTSPC